VNGFETSKGFVSPAKEAGIRPGDVIKTIAGEQVYSNDDVAGIIAENGGKSAEVVYLRDGELINTSVTPKLTSSGEYKIGMWVRDSSAGIGTLTFIDSNTGRFAGLGHPVCDTNSGELLPLYSGEAVDVTIGAVIKGRSGTPGELTGVFGSDKDDEIGKLLVNSYAGVYGSLDNGILTEETAISAIPLATRGQIKTGEAVILSTVDGGEPKSYTIRIDSIAKNSGNGEIDGKDMVITVTDEDLIDITGGIVQGMSGSPIIQNGRLIGAVTHVFVNNPQKGYAIFAETMYKQYQQNQQNEELIMQNAEL
jgi:stage IV sporulation protein B